MTNLQEIVKLAFDEMNHFEENEMLTKIIEWHDTEDIIKQLDRDKLYRYIRENIKPGDIWCNVNDDDILDYVRDNYQPGDVWDIY